MNKHFILLCILLPIILLHCRSKFYQDYQISPIGFKGYEACDPETQAKCYVFKYSLLGKLKAIVYMGIKRPVENEEGWASAIVENKGDDIEIRYFDRYQLPVVQSDGHFLTRISSQNSDNLMISYLNKSLKRIAHNGCLYYRVKHSDDIITEKSCIGPVNEPAIDNSGVHRTTWKTHSKEMTLEQASFGLQGEPVVSRQTQAHKIIWKYDHKGNQIEAAVYGREGQPIQNDAKIHRYTIKYDNAGHAIEQAFYSLKDKPAYGPGRVHRYAWKNDFYGNVIEQSCFGINGKPTAGSSRAHRTIFRLNENGDVVEQLSFGINGEPVLDADAVHQVIFEYDSKGNQTEESYFGRSRQSILNRDAVHHYIWKHNGVGKKVEQANFGRSGEPVLDRVNGVHRYKFKYDKNGNQTEKAYFGRDNEPVLGKDRRHRWELKYNDEHLLTEEVAYDLKGKPTNGRYNNAIVRYIYTSDGELYSKVRYNKNNRLVKEEVIKKRGAVK